MSTYGQIRMRLSQMAPGVSLDLLDGWIVDRYQELLDRMTWQRLDVERTLNTVAEYATGTLTATNGSTSLTGAGTTWTAAMTGRIIRIAGEADYYGFTRTGALGGDLDREYTGDGGSGLTYRINQNLFTLDTDVRLVRGIRTANGELTRVTVDELRRMAPDRNSYGEPEFWAWYPDAATDPPVIQVEFFPIPIEVHRLYLSLTIDTDGFAAGTSMQPWTRPAALIAGCMADVSRHLKEFEAADRYEARFDKLVGDMVRNEAAALGPQPLRMADRYTRHQSQRWSGRNHPYYDR